jgi:hypothetical protein
MQYLSSISGDIMEQLNLKQNALSNALNVAYVDISSSLSGLLNNKWDTPSNASNLSNVDILHNLKEILWFKKSLPDKVVLLLGNHDIQYFIPNEVCSGYRGEMRPDLYDLFTQNK